MGLNKILSILITSCIFIQMSANSGAFSYSGSGGNLMPLQETLIELKKEVLEFSLDKTSYHTKVIFHFFNPSQSSKKIKVGFVSNSSYTEQDVRDYFDTIPAIKNFNVMVDGKTKKFIIKRLKLEDDTILGYRGNEYIFLFDVVFKPGYTIIEHNYDARVHNDFDLGEGELLGFDYILNTGLLWANKEIEDFTMKLNLGERRICKLNLNHQDMKFSREGKIINELGIIRIQNGELIFKKQNFKPEEDIWINIWEDLHHFISYSYDLEYNELEDKDLAKQFSLINDLYSMNFTNLQCRTYRNLLFALHGYVFKSKDLKLLFNNQFWYTPNYVVSADVTRFSEYEKLIYDYIVSLEDDLIPEEAVSIANYILRLKADSLKDYGAGFGVNLAIEYPWRETSHDIHNNNMNICNEFLQQIYHYDRRWRYKDLRFLYKSNTIYIDFKEYRYIVNVNSTGKIIDIKKSG